MPLHLSKEGLSRLTDLKEADPIFTQGRRVSWLDLSFRPHDLIIATQVRERAKQTQSFVGLNILDFFLNRAKQTGSSWYSMLMLLGTAISRPSMQQSLGLQASATQLELHAVALQT